jgi:hypothetical protein
MDKTQENKILIYWAVINDLYIFKMYFKSSKSTEQKASGHRKHL